MYENETELLIVSGDTAEDVDNTIQAINKISQMRTENEAIEDTQRSRHHTRPPTRDTIPEHKHYYRDRAPYEWR